MAAKGPAVRLRALVVALALAHPAGAAAESLGAPAPPTREPAATQEAARRQAAVPADVLERLPPGARAVSDWSDGFAPEATGPEPPRYAMERVALPPDSPDGAWLDVEYTVDPALDARVRGVLAAAGVTLGQVILMDPESGEVFSYVSTEPEVFPATRAYPTASLMKVVTAAALLRHAPEAAGRSCRYQGSPWELQPAQLVAPSRGGHVDTFRRALAISNNQCFARLAVHDLGADALLGEMERLGFLEPPGPGHAAGRIASIHSDFALAQLGSGMAGSSITPLGAARLAAALAHGRLVEPRWIARVRDATGALRPLPARPAPRAVWPPEVAGRLREMLVGVTEQGTASRAFHGRAAGALLGALQVAGKTGTVSGTEPKGRYQWFIGVAPAEAPRIAIATLVVNGPARVGSASAVAAATLREVFCANGACAAAHAEPLLARAHAREAEIRAERARAAAEAFARKRAEDAARAEAARLAGLELAALDAKPRPIGDAGFDFPRRLLGRKVHGEIVLVLELNPQGEVLGVEIDSSELPDFDTFVADAVKEWRFTPPTQQGRPVAARARFPIAIQIN